MWSRAVRPRTRLVESMARAGWSPGAPGDTTRQPRLTGTSVVSNPHDWIAWAANDRLRQAIDVLGSE